MNLPPSYVKPYLNESIFDHPLDPLLPNVSNNKLKLEFRSSLVDIDKETTISVCSYKRNALISEIHAMPELTRVEEIRVN